MEPVIAIANLAKRYGATTALHGLDLEVPPGTVFGFIGPNGAGKTTTIRLLLGLLRPTAGSAQIFGLDCWRDRDRLHARLGYLPGAFVAYEHLTATRYLRYLADLRGDVSWSNVDLLAKRFDLDLDVRIDAMSHGTKQKVGLVQAFMHDPDVVILDEPTNGLDPLMQREFETLVRQARDDGKTVFLSSHVLHEVEEVADMIAIVRGGRLLVVDRVAVLRSRAVRHLDLTFAGLAPLSALRSAQGVRDVQPHGRSVRLAIEGSMEDVLRVAAPFGIETVRSDEGDLEGIFFRAIERSAS